MVSLYMHSVTGWIKFMLIVTLLLNFRSYFLSLCYYGGNGCHEGPTCHLLVGPGGCVGWSQSPMCIIRRFYRCLKNFFKTPGIALVPATRIRMLLYQIMSFQATGKLPFRNTLEGSEISVKNGTSWHLTRDPWVPPWLSCACGPGGQSASCLAGKYTPQYPSDVQEV